MKLFPKFVRHAVLALGLFALGSLSAVAAPPVAGKDYTILQTPQPTSSGSGKVEVVEFFSYGCPHCSHLEPLLEAWQKKLPKDVVLKRVAVPWQGYYQRLYLTLEAMGESERLNGQVFRAIHVENQLLKDEKTQTDWVAAHGVDRKKFADVYQSFAVVTGLNKGKQMTQDYKIEGIPALAIGGRYLTSASLPGTGSHEAALAVADQLIAKVRAEQGRK